MSDYIRPPDDVYWHFRRLRIESQVGAEFTSREDGYLYRVNSERRICRVVDGREVVTIDSLPGRYPAGAHVLTGSGWGFKMHISTFYQQVIARSIRRRPDRIASVLLSIIRVGIYELVYSPATPVYSIVNEAVSNVEKTGGKKQPGFVNAVLRG